MLRPGVLAASEGEGFAGQENSTVDSTWSIMKPLVTAHITLLVNEVAYVRPSRETASRAASPVVSGY